MKIKNKLCMLLLACVMSVITCVTIVCADENFDVKEIAVLVEGDQTVELGKSDGLSYFSFTAKEDGVYKFSPTYDIVNHAYSLGALLVLDDKGEILNDMYQHGNGGGVRYRLNAGQKVYMALSCTLSEGYEKVSLNINVKRVDSGVQVFLEYEDKSKVEVFRDNIEGLSWDASSATLIMNNYTAKPGTTVVVIDESSDETDYYRGELIKLKVKGVNNFLSDEDGTSMLELNDDVKLYMVDDGIINFKWNNVKSYYSCIVYGDVIIDGPSINCIGKRISLSNFELKSGRILFDLYQGYFYPQPTYLTVLDCDNIIMSGGTMIVKYEKPKWDDYDSISFESPLYARDSIKITGGKCIFIVDKDIMGDREMFYCSKEDGINIYPNVPIISSSVIDINNFELEVLDKKLTYDGKEKKARVKIEGLVEGKDYKVEYKNNVNVGKADIIVTGIGDFKGTIKTTFEIVAANGEPTSKSTNSTNSSKKANSIVGIKFKDKNFTYKITKEVSADGKVKGKVTLVSLNNKIIKKVVVKSVVKYDGKKYSVTSIGKCAFAKCKKLRKITIKSTKINKFGKKAFAKTSKKLVVKVPKKVKKKYVKKLRKAGYKGSIK